MRHFFVFLLMLLPLGACSLIPDQTGGDGGSLPPDTADSPMVPVGDDHLKAAVETASTVPAPSPTEEAGAGGSGETGTGEPQATDRAATPEAPLDESIDPGVQQEMAQARRKLDQSAETPAPADSEASGNLWDRLRKQFRLDLDQDNRRIRAQLNWYASHPDYIKRTIDRASRYMHHIVEEVERRDIPGEMALLPIVESAFDPFAYSHGRASGLWQFIPSTGRHFGLEQNWWYDGRRDVIAATDAALRYLTLLSDRFDGDWLLGLAAYNSGALTVERAIRRNEKLGRDTDFWSLRLPRETRAYAPKLLAIAKLFANPEAYGIALPPLPDEPYFETVDTGSQIDLAQAAELAGVDVEEIYLLNPAFNRWATAPAGPHRLLVPREAAETFRQALADLPREKRLSWQNYRVRRGDSLIAIARRFHTTPEVIRDINRLKGNLIRVGQDLLIPAASEDGGFYALSSEERLAAKQAAYGGEGKTRVDYRVRRGDTLWDIARKYRVNHRQLAKWNNMAPGDPLMPGRELVIWTRTAPRVAAIQMPKRKNMVRKIGYRVRSGDSLYRIANRFNVTVGDLVGWNDIDPDRYLQPGDRLTLFIDIRRSP